MVNLLIPTAASAGDAFHSQAPSTSAVRASANPTAAARFIVVSSLSLRPSTIAPAPLAPRMLLLGIALVLLFLLFLLVRFLLRRLQVPGLTEADPGCDSRGRRRLRSRAVALVRSRTGGEVRIDREASARSGVVHLQEAPVLILGNERLEGREVHVDAVPADRFQAGLEVAEEDR